MTTPRFERRTDNSSNCPNRLHYRNQPPGAEVFLVSVRSARWRMHYVTASPRAPGNPRAPIWQLTRFDIRLSWSKGLLSIPSSIHHQGKLNDERETATLPTIPCASLLAKKQLFTCTTSDQHLVAQALGSAIVVRMILCKWLAASDIQTKLEQSHKEVRFIHKQPKLAVCVLKDFFHRLITINEQVEMKTLIQECKRVNETLISLEACAHK